MAYPGNKGRLIMAQTPIGNIWQAYQTARQNKIGQEQAQQDRQYQEQQRANQDLMFQQQQEDRQYDINTIRPVTEAQSAAAMKRLQMEQQALADSNKDWEQSTNARQVYNMLLHRLDPNDVKGKQLLDSYFVKGATPAQLFNKETFPIFQSEMDNILNKQEDSKKNEELVSTATVNPDTGYSEYTQVPRKFLPQIEMQNKINLEMFGNAQKLAYNKAIMDAGVDSGTKRDWNQYPPTKGGGVNVNFGGGSLAFDENGNPINLMPNTGQPTNDITPVNAPPAQQQTQINQIQPNQAQPGWNSELFPNNNKVATPMPPTENTTSGYTGAKIIPNVPLEDFTKGFGTSAAAAALTYNGQVLPLMERYADDKGLIYLAQKKSNDGTGVLPNKVWVPIWNVATNKSTLTSFDAGKDVEINKAADKYDLDRRFPDGKGGLLPSAQMKIDAVKRNEKLSDEQRALQIDLIKTKAANDAAVRLKKTQGAVSLSMSLTPKTTNGKTPTVSKDDRVTLALNDYRTGDKLDTPLLNAGVDEVGIIAFKMLSAVENNKNLQDIQDGLYKYHGINDKPESTNPFMPKINIDLGTTLSDATKKLYKDNIIKAAGIVEKMRKNKVSANYKTFPNIYNQYK